MLRRALRIAIAVTVPALAACSGSQHAARRSNTTTSVLALTTVPSSTTTAPTPVVTTPVVTAPATTEIDMLVSNGVQRSYRLHKPPSSLTIQPAPLVVVLHGATGNAARVEVRYHWDQLADRDHFYVAYPQGLYDVWNPTADPQPMDDLRFLSELIDHLRHTLPVDAGRIFVAGMSNGGAMAYRLGCAIGDRIAAIAAVEAPNPGCRPTHPLSLIAVHGLADHQVSIDAAQRAVTSWREVNSCPAAANTGQAGAVTSSVWEPCAANTAVELVTVAGSGHEWPGSSPPLPGHDPPSDALDATQAIWTFFTRHAR